MTKFIAYKVSIRISDPGQILTLRFMCHFELRRRMAVVWDFKGQTGNSHGARKADTWCTSVCCAVFIMGHREDLDLMSSLGSSLSVILNSH